MNQGAYRSPNLMPIEIKFIIEPTLTISQTAIPDIAATRNLLPKAIFDKINKHVGKLHKTTTLMRNRGQEQEMSMVKLLCELRGKIMEIDFMVVDFTTRIFVTFNTIAMAELVNVDNEEKL